MKPQNTTDPRNALADECERHEQNYPTAGLLRRCAAALRSQPGKPDREEVVRKVWETDGPKYTGWPNISERVRWGYCKQYPHELQRCEKIADAILALTPSHEASTQEPVAWGRIVDGKAVTVSREWTPANDEPLYYAAPASHGTREATIEECARIVRDYLVKRGVPETAADLIEKIRATLSPIRADRAVSAKDREEDGSEAKGNINIMTNRLNAPEVWIVSVYTSGCIDFGEPSEIVAAFSTSKKADAYIASLPKGERDDFHFVERMEIR